MQILHRVTGAVLFVGGNSHDLYGAHLDCAALGGANLEDVDLSGADLRGADLRGADLRGANLRDANILDCDFAGADFAGAKLTGCDLTDVSFRGTNIHEADLAEIREDVVSILDRSRAEVPGLLDALRSGRVDGSVYQGDCACLIGTLANIRGCSYKALAPDSARPAERWFMGINEGDTPTSNPVSAITEQWITEWMGANA